MRVLGIDPSLTATGLAVVTDAEPGTFGPLGLAVKTGRVSPSPERGHVRLAHIRSRVMQHAASATLVVIEGPSYGSSAGQSGHHERAGLWWLLAHALWSAGVPYAVVPPSNRARYATGKGNAGKDTVLLACERRYGGEGGVSLATNDEADALVLAAMGARALERAVEDSLPQANLAAMAGVTWPDLIGI